MDPALQRPDWTKSGARDPEKLWLDKNESLDDTFHAITLRVLREIDPRAHAVYPDCAPLYAALAKWNDVDPRTLLLAPGSDGVIGATFRTFIEPGDRVIHTVPTYQMYAVYARISGAKVTTLGYEQREGVPYLNVDDFVKTIRDVRPKLVCLPNPDSPTGTVLAPDQLERVIAEALSVGALMQVDEAYHPFYPLSAVPFVAKYPNVIVVRTFSKAWGMTGVRLGYGISSPEVTALLHKVRPNYEVNQVAVEMGVRMITEFKDEMLASVKRLSEGRDHFLASMRDLGFRTLPCHANFAHVAFDQHGDAVHAALSKIVLYRKDLVDKPLGGYSRFTTTTREKFEPVIACIRKAAGK